MLADGTAVCMRTFCCAKAGPASPANMSAISAPNTFLRNMVALHKPRHKASYFYDSHASKLALVSRGGKSGLGARVNGKKPNAIRASIKKFFATVLKFSRPPACHTCEPEDEDPSIAISAARA